VWSDPLEKSELRDCAGSGRAGATTREEREASSAAKEGAAGAAAEEQVARSEGK